MVSDVDIKKKNSLPRIGGSHREYPRFGDLEFVNWFQKKKKKKKKKKIKKELVDLIGNTRDLEIEKA